jgi:cysteinyl-tRNA synthetase
MGIQVYNSLTRRLEDLSPVKAGQVGMYVCGPTVYDDLHIGNLLGPVVFDAIARWLRARGHQVQFVNNITDIDDKIIARAKTTGEDWTILTRRYEDLYRRQLTRLGVETVSRHPRCSEYIPPMIAYIQDLIDRGFGYAAGDGIYFEVARLPEYGRLSGRQVADLLAGARIKRRADLRSPADFCLWKLAKPDEPSWPSPWGEGRPGWHIECSVMSSTLLGDTFDIHGGGDDLKFPHHENEIAQGRAHGGDYARIWMHNGMIQFEGVKVSKSDPRNRDPAWAAQFKAANILAQWGGPTVRFFMLAGHYRRPYDFAPSHLAAAQKALGRLHAAVGDLREEPFALDEAQGILDKIKQSIDHADQELKPRRVGYSLRIFGDRPVVDAARGFLDAMDEDFNTAVAISRLFTLVQLLHRHEGRPIALDTLAEDLIEFRRLIRDLGRLIGLFRPGDAVAPAGAGDDAARLAGLRELLADLGVSGTAADLAGLMAQVLARRQAARAERDFATADRIRDALARLGLTVQDGREGAVWTAGPPAAAGG